MRFGEYLLIEGSMGLLKTIADEVIDQMVDEDSWDHDTILNLVRSRLEQEPLFASDPDRMKAALQTVSEYIAPISRENEQDSLF